MTREELKVVIEAARWWKAHRPLSFDEKDHIECPKINCTDRDKRLAEAVAQLIKKANE